MDGVDNNQFEVKSNSKRKINIPCPNVYLNPALDLLVNDDRICNTAMEIIPKKRKRTKSDVATFENTGLELGNKVVNELLVREIDNVRRNVKYGNVDEATTENNSREISNNFKYGNRSADKLATDTLTEEILSNVMHDTIDNTLVTENLMPEIPRNVNYGNTYGNSLSRISKEMPSVSYEDLSNNQTFEDNISKNTLENTINFAAAPKTDHIYANLAESKTENDTINVTDISRIPHEDDLDSGISVDQKSNMTNIQTNISNQVVINNSNLSLSFIDRLALNSPNISDQSLYLDDDLNESNIMEIKTITIITKKKRIVEKKNTNPFLDPKLNNEVVVSSTNPFLEIKPELDPAAFIRPTERLETNVPDLDYQDIRPTEQNANVLMPRRLFDTNSTISTANESIEIHEYENGDFRVESPIYENIDELNKQSKILGHDVSQFSAIDIMNLNKMSGANSSNDSQDSKKEKNSFLKVSNKLSKKVFKTLKKTFKHDKTDTNTTLNPYEVPRKPPKLKEAKKEAGIENPALNLDISDDLEIEELSDEEHQYETIKTKRNTEYNMNVTPLKARDNEMDFLPNKTNTPGKKVRFDSTLNREKVITGNSFDYGMQSPGFDAKIEKYHDELENCINERKFLQQNM